LRPLVRISWSSRTASSLPPLLSKRLAPII
jgi:hypothetical protein